MVHRAVSTMMNLLSSSQEKQPNDDSLKKCFDVLVSSEDGKIGGDQIIACLAASGSRLLMYEINQYHVDGGKQERLDWSAVQSINQRQRYLDEQWHKENQDIAKGNVFDQTDAALKVLIDSYGQNGLIDVVNLRYVLTSCGEEMTDEEFDEALRMVGQSTKGMFNIKKMLQTYAELAAKMGRQDAMPNWEATKVKIELAKKETRDSRSKSRRGSGLLGGVGSQAPSRCVSVVHSVAPSEAGD